MQAVTFGALLRHLRVAAGLSQEALAERAHISAKAIGSLEVGARRAPYRETVEQLLIALDATPEERSQLTSLAEAARSRKPRATVTPEPVQRENLPSPPTRLIGRAREVAAAAALLGSHRLVTLVGPGGVGKNEDSDRGRTRAAFALSRRRVVRRSRCARCVFSGDAHRRGSSGSLAGTNADARLDRRLLARAARAPHSRQLRTPAGSGYAALARRAQARGRIAHPRHQPRAASNGR